MSYLPHDAYVGRSLATYGEFSEAEQVLFRALLRPDDVALDVGANIGAHTIGMAQAVGVRGVVHAFEPQKVICDILRTNIAQNGIANTVAHQEAVGAAPGRVRVPPLDYYGAGNFGGIELGGAVGEEVPVVTVDSVGLPRLRMMKIDVEGMELDVLKGAASTIRRFGPALYLENDRAESSAGLIAFVFGLGYRLWWHLTPLFNPNNFFGYPEDVFTNTWSFNVIGFPASDVPSMPLPEITSPDDLPRAPDGSIPKFGRR